MHWWDFYTISMALVTTLLRMQGLFGEVGGEALHPMRVV